MKYNVVWIDEDLDNDENRKYVEELKSFGSLFFNIGLFKNLDEAISHLKGIKFQETKVITSGKLYPEFMKKFIENIIEMYVAPKIIIFTRNKKIFNKNNKFYQNNSFYNYGGVVDTFQEVKKFLKKEKIDDVQLTFEYIDKKEKLLLPLFFKALIDNYLMISIKILLIYMMNILKMRK